jgi:transposase
VVKSLEAWLRKKLGLLSRKSNLAEAIRYALSRRAGFSL